MYALFAPLLGWLFREIIVKFFIMAAVYLVITILVPIMLDKAAPYLGVANLTSAFAQLSPGVWYFLDMARLDYGLPIVLSAATTLFICRRIPFLNGR